jgi:hypothetical protein
MPVSVVVCSAPTTHAPTVSPDQAKPGVAATIPPICRPLLKMYWSAVPSGQFEPPWIGEAMKFWQVVPSACRPQETRLPSSITAPTDTGPNSARPGAGRGRCVARAGFWACSGAAASKAPRARARAHSLGITRVVSFVMMIVSLTVIAAQRASQHDMLDASMFWAGLFMVLTPLLLIGGVLGYLWWSRRRRSARPVQEP